jgi:hypothetical protein
MPNNDLVIGAPDPAPTPVKPGYKTTEFWLKVAALVLTALFASGAIPTSGPLATVTAIAATMLGALGYTVSRAFVKNAAVALLVIGLAFGAASTLTACTAAQRSAVESALWKCTDPVRSEAVAALTPLAESAIKAAASADGKLIDYSLVKAMFSKANLTSEAGVLLTCAAASAFAALAIPSPSLTGAPASMPMVLDRGALHDAFDRLRAEQFPGGALEVSAPDGRSEIW